VDRLLEETRSGNRWLARPEIARLMVDAIRNGDASLKHYRLHAFVVMPNHVHLLVTPLVPVPRLLQSLKGATARWANRILGISGEAFWQDESYDRCVRDAEEFRRIQAYIERNPVRAGLAHNPEEYPWSSAWRGPD